MCTRSPFQRVYVYGPGLLYEVDASENTKTYHYDGRGSPFAAAYKGRRHHLGKSHSAKPRMMTWLEVHINALSGAKSWAFF